MTTMTKGLNKETINLRLALLTRQPLSSIDEVCAWLKENISGESSTVKPVTLMNSSRYITTDSEVDFEIPFTENEDGSISIQEIKRSNHYCDSDEVEVLEEISMPPYFTGTSNTESKPEVSTEADSKEDKNFLFRPLTLGDIIFFPDNTNYMYIGKDDREEFEYGEMNCREVSCFVEIKKDGSKDSNASLFLSEFDLSGYKDTSISLTPASGDWAILMNGTFIDRGEYDKMASKIKELSEDDPYDIYYLVNIKETFIPKD